MIRKLSMFLFLVLFAQVFVMAQESMVLGTDGVLHKLKSFDEARQLSPKELAKIPSSKNYSSFSKISSPNGTIDTLRYDNLFPAAATTFGFSAQDVGVQWFVAPADLIIKGVAFNLTENVGITASNAGFEIKVVKVKWTEAQLKAQKDEYIGYYNATGNGYNDITASPSNTDYTGGWVAAKVDAPSPFDSTDVWSDNGVGYPESDYTLGVHWIMTSVIGEPTIKAGEIFGIYFKVNGAINADRNALRAAEVGFPGWKFYGAGRNSIDDKGWWSRTYTWDMRALVDLVGDRAPVIVKYDQLPTTISTAARTVTATITDDNPSGGPAGVQSAVIRYSIDKGVTWSDIAMTAAGDVYSGDIPGQPRGTTVIYKIVATDVQTNVNETGTVTYLIFNPTGVPTLIVFNGYAKTTGYPAGYYFGYNGATSNASEILKFPADKWAYGALTQELVDYYTNIIEITTTGPKKINNAVIKTWLEANKDHNYALTGDEYLGSITGWVNTTYNPGDFQYDILGVAKDFNDVSYAVKGDEKKASLAAGVAGTTLGDSLHLKVVELAEDSLLIYPSVELGAAYSNWLDGFEPVQGTVVDVTGVGIDGNTYNVGSHRTLAAGNKIAFLAFDPLSLDSPSDSYFWYGFDRVSPLVQVAQWFGALASGPPTVEFKCNMSVQMKRGTFAATDSVWVRGNFNDWAGKATQLTDPDGDSVYTGVFNTFTLGQSLVFKYVHSPDVWESTGNRTLTVAAGANVTSACWEDVCVYVPSKTIKVAFTVNMELERLSGLFNPATNNVSVRGSFNGWGETKMTPSGINADSYEVVADVIAAVDEKVSFKFFYSPGTWEINHLTDTTQNDRYFIISQADFDAGTKSYDAPGFNNGTLDNVLNQDAHITFTVNTNNASIINTPQGTAFSTVHIAGGNAPLQWPGGGWPDADITKVIQLFDDGTHGDVTAGDKIFTTDTIVFPKYSNLTKVYKYGANWGLPTNGGANDNEAGVGADKTLILGKFTAQAVVVDTFGVVHTTVVGIKTEKVGSEIPTVFALAQNFPNPFNPETSIRFSVPQESFVTVKVFNTLGEEVMTLVNEEKTAGIYNVSFNAKNLTSGIYFYSIKANDFTSTKKMILMK